MFGLLKSVVELGANLTSVAVAPVEIAVDVAKAVVKPVAEIVESVVKDVKSGLK